MLFNKLTKMNFTKTIYVASIFFLFSCSEKNRKTELFQRIKFERMKGGYINSPPLIPSDTIAIGIAEIILKNLYGDEIETERPLKIDLYKDSIWIIKGTQPIKGPNYRGGVVYIELRKSDGKVITVFHGK
jgi:hypothetical protein